MKQEKGWQNLKIQISLSDGQEKQREQGCVQDIFKHNGNLYKIEDKIDCMDAITRKLCP